MNETEHQREYKLLLLRLLDDHMICAFPQDQEASAVLHEIVRKRLESKK